MKLHTTKWRSNKDDFNDFQNFVNQPTTALLTERQLDYVYNTEEDNELFDRYFQLQDFCPQHFDKAIDEGSWIRVKTAIGYNVYWAKRAARIRTSAEQLQRRLDTANRQLGSNSTTQQLLAELKVAQLYYVKIMCSKSTVQYVLPYKYGVGSDSQLYTTAGLQQVFYLQSRGIDRDAAILLAKLLVTNATQH